MDERVLFLSRLEFSVLLLAEGITNIVCFPLPDEKNVNKKQMIEAIYELVHMDCIQVGQSSVTLTDSIKKMIKAIKEAKFYLMAEPGDTSLPQKICYMGNQIAVLENVREEGKAFRLFSMEKDEFWKWMENSMELPEAMIEKKSEANRLIEWNELALKERKLLIACGAPKEFQKLSGWMEQVKKVLQEIPYVGFYVVRGKKQRVKIEFLICRGEMNTWFLWKEAENEIFQETPIEKTVSNMHIEPDSLELRQEILDMLYLEDRE